VDPTPGPVLRRRQVGTRLRQLREAAGRSLVDVAAYLDCSAAKISRIETGRLPARTSDVRNMLDLYDVAEPERGHLLALVRESREKGWWHTYTDILVDGYDTYLGLEESASALFQYETYLVPGLLQTRDYAYAVQANRNDIAEETAERYIEVRMHRQAILSRPNPPALSYVLDESVLHRTAALGAVTGRAQLDQIAILGRRPNITLQILPYSAGICTHVSFTIFGFPDPGDPKVMYLEGLTGPAFESKIETVGRYAHVYDGLRSAALPPEESIAMVAALAATLG
jgi:transcriptional regulator with XRE-family HTH domain